MAGRTAVTALSGGYVLRPARVDDVEAIFDLRVNVVENRLSRAELAGIGITPAVVAEMIRTQHCCWVAARDGALAGFTLIDRDEGSLFALFVRAMDEGRGIGAALLRQAETELFARHESIWLETGRGTRAAAFYQRQGWRVDAESGANDLRFVKRRDGVAS